MRFFILLLNVCLIMCAACQAYCVGLPNGTSFSLEAGATYSNTKGDFYTADPAYATLTVAQVAAVKISQVTSPSKAVTGQILYLPITITNTGNGTDSFSLVVSSKSGWSTSVIQDDNRDGIHQSTENYVISNTGSIVANGHASCFIKVSVPTGAKNGDTIKVTAISNTKVSVSDSVDITIPSPAIPVVTITVPTTSKQYSTNSAKIYISGTAKGTLLQSVTWSNDRGGSGTCIGTLSWSASSITLKPGSNIITVSAKDTAGNIGLNTLTVSFVDINAPTVNIGKPTSAATYTTALAAIDLSGIASDNVELSSVSWSSDKGGSGICTGTTSWNAAKIVLTQGINVITITACDSSGNKATDKLSVTCTNSSPKVNIVSPTSASTYNTIYSTLNLAGTASSGVELSELTWSTDKGASGSCVGLTNWTASGILLAEGSTIITITAKDKLNRTSSASLNVVRKSGELTVEITSPSSKSSYARNAPLLVLGGTASGSVDVMSVVWSTDSGDSGICSGTNNWTTSDIGLNVGKNIITVVATNNNGETKSASVEVEYIDALPGDAWRGFAMVSLPIIPDVSDPKEVVGFTDYWSAFDTRANSFSVYPNAYTWFEPKENTPGRGFWARFGNEQKPFGMIPDQSKPVTISLKRGWNLIGQPFITPVTWSLNTFMVSDASGIVRSLGAAQDSVAPYAKGWKTNDSDPNTGAYYFVYDKTLVPDAYSELVPWQAYWIKAYKDCNLIIPAPE